MHMEKEILIPNRMDYDQIKKWKEGEFLKKLTGLHKCGHWKININKDLVGNVCIIVTGHNEIQFGMFKLDNGYIKDDIYYPVMTFHNKLSFGVYGWEIADTLSKNVDFGNKDYCNLTLDLMVKAIDESWNIIKDFLNK